MVGNDQAGAGHYDCPQDYLQLANIPLCGSRLNSQLIPPTPNPTTNAEVVGKYTHLDPTKQLQLFHSNHLFYRQLNGSNSCKVRFQLQ